MDFLFWKFQMCLFLLFPFSFLEPSVIHLNVYLLLMKLVVLILALPSSALVHAFLIWLLAAGLLNSFLYLPQLLLQWVGEGVGLVDHLQLVAQEQEGHPQQALGEPAGLQGLHWEGVGLLEQEELVGQRVVYLGQEGQQEGLRRLLEQVGLQGPQVYLDHFQKGLVCVFGEEALALEAQPLPHSVVV